MKMRTLEEVVDEMDANVRRQEKILHAAKDRGYPLAGERFEMQILDAAFKKLEAELKSHGAA